MIKLLVTDLDDTLYSWIGFFVPAFYAMAEEVAAITHVDFRVILSEYKTIHQLTGSVETPFATLQLPSVKRAFPDMKDEQMKEQLDSAFHRFYSVRKRQLKLFPGVRETLEETYNSGIRIVGYTESASENGVYRLRQLNIESFFSRIYVSNSWKSQGKENSLQISEKTKVVTGKKPNVDVLRQIVADQNATPNSVLYIGDSLTKDIFMAKQLGVKSVLFSDPAGMDPGFYEKLVAISSWTQADFLREAQIKEECIKKAIRPDFEITAFSELKEIIAALKKGERFELFSASTGINYCNLVHYISAPEEKYYSRRLSMRISQIINNNLSQMYYQITQHYCGYVSKNQQKKLPTWAKTLIQMNFSFDLFKMLVQCDARISKAAKTQLKVYLKQRIDAAKNKNNNGVVVYPTKQPYEELDQVGYWCLLNVLKAKDFQEFLGNSEAFDFYCEYAKFDFSRFDVSWLLNLYPHTLEQIAKNAKVKERVRVAIATTLDGEAIAPSDSQRLQSILVKHFC